MTVDLIQSQFEELQSISLRFTRNAETIRKVQREVTHQSQRLASSWEGAAATAFQRETGRVLLPALSRLSKALEQAGATTRGIRNTVKRAEEEAARLFQSTPVSSLAENGAGGGGLYAAGAPMMAAFKSDNPSTFPQEPVTAEGYVIENVKQTELNVFLSQYEDSGSISDGVLEKYLTNPELMAIQHDVILTLVERVQNGEPPLTAEEFYELVLAETGDPGTALIVSHNILKSFSRGRSPIGWAVVSRDPLVYEMNGQEFTFDANTFHPDAVAETGSVPTVFYAMFSADEFVTNDPGDWYHFYLTAAASYYGATGQIEFNDSSAWIPNYEEIVDESVDGTMNQMNDGMTSDESVVQGWTYANSLSFLEGAVYGADGIGSQAELQAETQRESELHRDGALFGLEQAGVTPGDDLVWYVPTAGSIGEPGVGDVLFGNLGADLDDDTYVILDADSEPIVEPTAPPDSDSGGRR